MLGKKSHALIIFFFSTLCLYIFISIYTIQFLCPNYLEGGRKILWGIINKIQLNLGTLNYARKGGIVRFEKYFDIILSSTLYVQKGNEIDRAEEWKTMWVEIFNAVSHMHNVFLITIFHTFILLLLYKRRRWHIYQKKYQF